MEASNPLNTQRKRVCSGRFTSISESSCLDALPLDILVSCGVDHEDLEQLFPASKTIKEAAEIVKKFHFEYSTPKTKTVSAFYMLIDVDDAKSLRRLKLHMHH